MESFGRPWLEDEDHSAIEYMHLDWPYLAVGTTGSGVMVGQCRMTPG